MKARIAVTFPRIWEGPKGTFRSAEKVANTDGTLVT